MKDKCREIIELALGTADVESITPKLIGKTVEDVARHKVVFAQLFRPLRDYINTPGRTIVVPKLSDNITVVSDVSEGETIGPSSFSYSAVTAQVSKFGIKIPVYKEALESPVRDVLKDALLFASEKYADEIDKRACTIALDLKEGTISSWEGGTLGTTTLTPIIEITSVSGATIESVDYYDGKVKLTGSVSAATVTFLYSNRCKSTGLVRDATTKGSVTVKDILELRASMIESSIYPDIMIIHSSDLPSLMSDGAAQGLFESAYEKEDTLNGEIGQLMDLRMLVSGSTKEGAVILVDSSRLGVDVTKRELTGIKEDKPEFDSVWYHLWAERELAVTDDNAIGVLVNVKRGTYKAADL